MGRHVVGEDRIGLLYAEHNSWLTGWLYRRLGCTSQAADLAQDTFLRILTSQRKTGETLTLDRPRAYLATVGQRLVCDYFRRQSLERAYLDMLALVPEAFALSPEEQWQMRETLLQLDALLDRLKPVVRAVFLLAQIDGLTYVQIARELGIGERTVKRHMATAFEACILSDVTF
ncbi:sigma-70 family RNA polymerase sigma factor [Pseudomonas cichorii]|nr:sigma-70 family RNA polymerase sigma factor [Pseudomonas cichorii]MBI6853998.1 sigma-70 family RNA polymerase sigma factor [Pseudomonas cichorii]MBX8536768.1 sigma-70 family RNA polymerase sigma factor [Pseudomonas cichorii]MBX8540703.1 sigma-70 family RNA polymerase sigma factor [Pseudomonas cichorii]MBX8570204.1 sigma-70 family RNA polymerase sigma factor [Pseudomonas cichorii]MBX8580427.1 sigma-70 family RNA polymerase sigma factor [Pseudomonas cichorii]